MDQINHIIHNRYIGGTPDISADVARDVRLLQGPGALALGLPKIDLILDCRSPGEVEDDRAWAAYRGVPPVAHTGMHDDGYHENDPAMLVKAGEAVQERAAALGVSPKNLGVFVHCHMGINRAPSTAMYLLMKFHGMTARQAFSIIREKRVGAALAYARLALETHLGNHPRAQEKLETWDRFEAAYWTPERIEGINTIILANHHRSHTRLIEDAAGLLHGVGR